MFYIFILIGTLERTKDILAKEFQYYLNNQEKLVINYNGKYIVIKDEEVLGSYNTIAQAYKKASDDYAIGTFLIQFVSPGDEGYTQTFHSRISFVKA